MIATTRNICFISLLIAASQLIAVSAQANGKHCIPVLVAAAAAVIEAGAAEIAKK